MEKKQQYVIFSAAVVVVLVSFMFASMQQRYSNNQTMPETKEKAATDTSTTQPNDISNEVPKDVISAPSSNPKDIPAENPVNVPVNTPTVWGAYTGNTIESLQEFEKTVDKKPDINAIFINWQDPFPASIVKYLKENNQTALIYWEQYGVTLDEISSGKYDDYIREFSNNAKQSGGTIILAPFHEMNGNWDPWDGTTGTNSPQKIILAWRHIHDVFGSSNNITWAFDVNNGSVPNTPENDISVYYPGDAYVDYVGVDGFNSSDEWQSYDEMFSYALDKLAIYHKPIYIFSFASGPDPKKANWIKDAISRIYSDPRIRGWVWFNENKEENWLIWSDKNSLKAFQSSIK